MKPLSFTWQLAAVTLLVLSVAYVPDITFSAITLGNALRIILSGLLVASVLCMTLTFSRWSGVKAAAGIFILYWGVSHFNTLNEAMFFGIELGSHTLGGLAFLSVMAVAMTALGSTYIAGRWEEGVGPAGPGETIERTPLEWAGRLLLAAFVYFVFYFIAGIIIFPYVQEFYSGRPLPGLGEVFAMQILRGLVYAGIATMVLRMVALSRNALALLMGAALSILGGIAPLLPPNSFMPEHVRMVHMAEIGVSNFFAGILMMRILSAKGATQEQ